MKTWLGIIQYLWCKIRRHKYSVIRPLLIGGELVRCEKCGYEICVHHGRQQVIAYDDDIKQFESELKQMMDKSISEEK